MRFLMLLTLAVATCQPTGPHPQDEPAGERTASPQEGVVLTTNRQSYSTGEQVRLTLRNESRQPLGFNLCMSTLERRQGEEWVPVPADPTEVCPAILGLLPAGESTHHTFTLDRDLPAGEYRFRTELEHMDTGARGAYVSSTFQLRR